MTCIVGLRHHGGVIIGGDSASLSGWQNTSTNLKKVFELQSSGCSLIVGYTSSFRMGQIIQHSLDVPPFLEGTEDPMDYLVNSFVEKVRNQLKVDGYLKTESGRESIGRFLVGFQGMLYLVDKDLSVNSSCDGYMALGHGSEYALGSLYSTQGKNPINPWMRVKQPFIL